MTPDELAEDCRRAIKHDDYLEERRNRVPPSPQEIADARTTRGGWTKAQLADWGIAWPPQRGWKDLLEEKWHRQFQSR